MKSSPIDPFIIEHYPGMSMAAIARNLNVPASRVKSRVYAMRRNGLIDTPVSADPSAPIPGGCPSVLISKLTLSQRQRSAITHLSPHS